MIVWVTAERIRVETERAPDGSLEVRVGASSESEPYFVRRFEPRESAEVRIFLKNRDDRAVSRGGGPASI